MDQYELDRCLINQFFCVKKGNMKQSYQTPSVKEVEFIAHRTILTDSNITTDTEGGETQI